MKKLFISQPMRGRSREEILAERENAICQAKEAAGGEAEIIDSYFENAPAGSGPLWCLGESLKLLACADIAYFAAGWEGARGCRIEHICAEEYGVCILEAPEKETEDKEMKKDSHVSDIRVTKEQIDRLMNGAEVQAHTQFGKCTVVTVRLENGFILTEDSACVDPVNYDEELGRKLCLAHIRNRLWELEGYAMQKRVHEAGAMLCGPERDDVHDFGWALKQLRSGRAVCRRGWNGKAQYVELATRASYVNAGGEIINAEHDAIGNRVLAFVGTSGVQLGWLASQADLLAEDWETAAGREDPAARAEGGQADEQK